MAPSQTTLNKNYTSTEATSHQIVPVVENRVALVTK